MMLISRKIIGRIALLLTLAAAPGIAAPPGARMISPPRYGTIREVIGATLDVVRVGAACAPANVVGPDRLCLAGPRPRAGETLRVLAVENATPGTRITGDPNRDFRVYAVTRDASGLQVQRQSLPASRVMVPRGCFALAEQPVGYVIHAEAGRLRAVESQLVSCGGGPAQPHGPYQPDGPPLPSDPQGWRPTATLYVAGAPRYLAVPDPACPPQFHIRESHCARSAIAYLDANPSLREVDLVAAKGAVRDGETLPPEVIMQWVLKRRDNGFKADSRWFQKSMVAPENGCTPLEPVSWHVGTNADGFLVTEMLLSRCGAPLAPVPTAIYEVPGADLFLLDCRWSDGPATDPACKAQAQEYLRRSGRDAADFLVAPGSVREGDRLYAGGYLPLVIVRAEKQSADITIRRGALPSMRPSAGCTNTGRGGPADGLLIVRAGGILWARRYGQMECAAY
ncbi:MAG: hypothetical protein KGN34_02935 [Sphingomonadales bacterium]|nr:hypothetical protein [Sphingomonadales bacterium]